MHGADHEEEVAGFGGELAGDEGAAEGGDDVGEGGGDGAGGAGFVAGGEEVVGDFEGAEEAEAVAAGHRRRGGRGGAFCR